MAWSRARGAKTHIEIHEFDSNNQWISIDGPGYATHNWMTPHHDPLHALLRPFDHALTSGKPVVGHVQYQFIKLPNERFYRVGHAVSVRKPREQNPDELLPGTIMLFPGIGARWPIGRNGVQGYCHHVGVREIKNRRIKVSTHFRPGSGPRSVAEHNDSTTNISNDADIFHIGQMMVKARHVLDEAGIALLKIPDGAKEARRARGHLWPELSVREHPVVHLEANSDLWGRPNYLWTGYFIAQKPPNQAISNEIHRFFLHQVARERSAQSEENKSGIEYDPDYDGDIHSHLSAVDLSAAGRDATYRYLVTLSAIVPGRLESGMNIAMFRAELT